MCSDEDCTAKAVVKGMCKRCYKRAAYRANPESVLAPMRRRRAERREAINAADRARRIANAETYRARDRARYAEDPSRKRDSQLRSSYGIGLAEYEAMRKAQGGQCAICSGVLGAPNKALAVDHSHETGAVRGLLCARCNVGIGMFKDDVAVMARAIEYLTHSASREVASRAA